MSKQNWTIEEIRDRLMKIRDKGFIGIPKGEYRRDDGIIGQILEKEFDLKENNLRIRDLGSFELKGMRKKSSTLTLCHKTTDKGLTPLEIFDRFSYIRESKRQQGILKKKLFTTVKGNKYNNLGLKLSSFSASNIQMNYKAEFICNWDLTDSLQKIDQVILVLAESKGKTNSKEEMFYYTEGFILDNLKPLTELIDEGIIVVDFTIDQPADLSKSPHDRGPHIRVPKSKIKKAYNKVTKLI